MAEPTSSDTDIVNEADEARFLIENPDLPQVDENLLPLEGPLPSPMEGPMNEPEPEPYDWNKVFTDQEYFDEIAKSPRMRQGAETSLYGDDYVYREAMIDFMADQQKIPVEQMRKIYDETKDRFASRTMGKQFVTSKELFEWQRGEFDKVNKKTAAGQAVLEAVLKRSLEDSLYGTQSNHAELTKADIDTFGKELLNQREKDSIRKVADRLNQKVREAQAPFVEDAKWLFDALGKQTGIIGQQKASAPNAMLAVGGLGTTVPLSAVEYGSPDAPTIEDAVNRFAELPDDQINKVFDLAAGFATLAKVDKTVIYQLAESVGRMASGTYKSTKGVTLETQLRQARQMAQQGYADDALPTFGDVGMPAPMRQLTPEEQAAKIKVIDQQLKLIKLERKIRMLAERKIDPIKTVSTWMPEWMEEGLYGAGSTLSYSLMAAIPLVGLPLTALSLYSQGYEELMEEFPDMPPEKAMAIAAVAAPFRAGIEKLQFLAVLGKRLPFTSKLLEKFIHPNQRVLTRTLLLGASGYAEQNIQELVENAIQPVAQTIGAALDRDIPDYNWGRKMDGFGKEVLVNMVATFPLSGVGMGFIAANEVGFSQRYLYDKNILARMGFKPEVVEAIASERDAEAKAEKFRTEFASRDINDINAANQQIIDDMVAAGVLSDTIAMPTIEKQGDEYVVKKFDGSEVLRTTDGELAGYELQRQLLSEEQQSWEALNLMVEAVRKIKAERGLQDQSVIELIESDRLQEMANMTPEQLKLRLDALEKEMGTKLDPADARVVGMNISELRDNIFRDVSRIAREGRPDMPLVVIEESIEGDLKRAWNKGTFTREETLEWVRQYEQAKDDQLLSDNFDSLTPEQQQDNLVEAVSSMGVAFFTGNIDRATIPARLAAFFRRVAVYIQAVLSRALKLREYLESGQMDTRFQQFFAESLGVTLDTAVNEMTSQAGANISAGDATFATRPSDPYPDRSDDPSIPLTPSEVAEAVEGQSGATTEQDIDEDAWDAWADDSFAVRPVANNIPVIDPKTLKGKKKFIYFSDRMRVGSYRGIDPASGIDIPLQGGPAYPFTKGNFEKEAGWAFSDVKMFTRFLKRILTTDGIGIVTLYASGNIRGNNTFLEAYFAEVAWAIQSGKLDQGDFFTEANRLREAALTTKKLKKKSDWVDLWKVEWKTLDQAKKALAESTFEVRGSLFFAWTPKKKGANKGAKIGGDKLVQRGFPNLTKMVELMEEPAFSSLDHGTMVAAVQFDKKQTKHSTAQSLKVNEHLSYPIIAKGKGIGYLSKQASALTVLKTNKKGRAALRSAETKMAGVSFAVRANKDSLRVKMTRQALTDAALNQASWKDWYEEHQAVLDDFFGDHAQLFQDILSITSQAASVKANVGLALKAFGQYMRGEPFDGELRGEESSGYLPAVIQNLERLREKTQLQGQKIRAYKASNDGKVDEAVIDRHISRLIFGVDSPSKAQFAKAQKILTEIANEIGWTPRQVQAALWAHSIYKSGKEPESYGAYLKKLEEKGTIQQRIGELGQRGTGGNAGRGGRGRFAPDGAAEGQASFAVRTAVTPEQDADYLAAIESGDIKTAQRMVDEAASKTPYLKRLYHATSGDGDFTVFFPWSHFGTKKSAQDRLNFVKSTFSPEESKRLNPKIFDTFVNISNPARVSEDVLDWDDASKVASALFDAGYLTDSEKSMFVDDNTTQAFRELQALLLSKGFDGIEYPNAIEDSGSKSYIVAAPNQIKSADPVTRDEQGNVIPLSKRFDQTTDNINYAIRSADFQSGIDAIAASLQGSMPVDQLTEILERLTEIRMQFEDAQNPSDVAMSAEDALNQLKAMAGMFPESVRAGVTFDNLAKFKTQTGRANYILDRIGKLSAIAERLRTEGMDALAKLDTAMSVFNRTTDVDYRRERVAAALDKFKTIRDRFQNKEPMEPLSQVESIAYMEAVLNMLPVEVRGKVGGMKRLAEFQTPEARADYLADRISKADEVLEEWLRASYLEEIVEIVERATDTVTDNRVNKSAIGPSSQRAVNYIAKVMDMTPKEVADEDAALQAKMNLPNTDPKDLSEMIEDYGLLAQFGGLGSKQLHDAAGLAAAYDTLVNIVRTGRIRWQAQEQQRIEENRKRKEASLDELGQAGIVDGATPTQLGRAEEKDNTAWRKVRDWIEGHLAWFQFLQETWGTKSATAKYFERRARQQTNSYENAQIADKFRFRMSMIRQMGLGSEISMGTMAKLNDALDALNQQRNSKAIRWENRLVVTQRIPVTTAIDAIFNGKASSLGFNTDEVFALDAALKAVPAGTIARRKFIEIDRVKKRGEQVAQRLSELEAIQDILSWGQEDVRVRMKRQGFTQEYIDSLNNDFLSKNGKIVLAFLRSEYATGYNKVNPVYRRMFGMDMPRVRNYAPTAYDNAQNDAPVGPDDMTPSVAGMAAGFIKQRVMHNAPIKRQNALMVYMRHTTVQNYWVNFAELVREMRGTIGSTEVIRAVRAKKGGRVANNLTKWIRGFDKNGLDQGDLPEMMTNLLNAQLSVQAVANLGWSVGTLMKQGSAMLGSAIEIGPKEYALGMQKLMRGELASTLPKVWSSDSIQRRIAMGYSPEARAVNQAAGISPSKLLALAERGMINIAQVDAAFTTISAAIAFDYYYNKAAQSMPLGMAEKAALEKMDEVIRRTAQPASFADRSLLEANRNPFVRVAFMFMSEARQKFAIDYLAAKRILRGEDVGKNAGKLAVSWVTLGLMTQLATDIFQSIFRGEDDLEDIWEWEDYAKAVMLGHLNGMMLAGPVVEGGLNYTLGLHVFNNAENPLLQTMGKVTRQAANPLNWEDAGDVVNGIKLWLQVAASVTGSTALAGTAAMATVAKDAVGLLDRISSEDE